MNSSFDHSLRSEDGTEYGVVYRRSGFHEYTQEIYVRKEEYDKTVEKMMEIDKEKNELKQHISQMGEMIVRIDGSFIQYFEDQTYSMCIISLNQDGKNLEHIKNKTYTICKEAVMRDGMAIEHVPLNNRTDDIFVLALMRTGMSLRIISKFVEHIPLHYCILAVKQDPEASVYVPFDDEYKEAWQIAIHGKPAVIKYLRPDTSYYNEMCLYSMAIDYKSYLNISHPSEEVTLDYIIRSKDWKSDKLAIHQYCKTKSVRWAMFLKTIGFWRRKR